MFRYHLHTISLNYTTVTFQIFKLSSNQKIGSFHWDERWLLLWLMNFMTNLFILLLWVNQAQWTGPTTRVRPGARPRPHWAWWARDDWADHMSKAQSPLSVMSLGCHERIVLGFLTLDSTVNRALGVSLSPSWGESRTIMKGARTRSE